MGVLSQNLYPADHPYSWQVIGSLEDLDRASLEDVKSFYRRWYVPNNVALVVAGDFDPAQARKWVEKYFANSRAAALSPRCSPGLSRWPPPRNFIMRIISRSFRS
jgi:zinc protease